MSSLPLGFLAPWQPKHDSRKIGATSLMKLTGLAGALSWAACNGAGDSARNSQASAAARAAQRMQKQYRERNMRVTPRVASLLFDRGGAGAEAGEPAGLEGI